MGIYWNSDWIANGFCIYTTVSQRTSGPDSQYEGGLQDNVGMCKVQDPRGSVFTGGDVFEFTRFST